MIPASLLTAVSGHSSPWSLMSWSRISLAPNTVNHYSPEPCRFFEILSKCFSFCGYSESLRFSVASGIKSSTSSDHSSTAATVSLIFNRFLIILYTEDHLVLYLRSALRFVFVLSEDDFFSVYRAPIQRSSLRVTVCITDACWTIAPALFLFSSGPSISITARFSRWDSQPFIGTSKSLHSLILVEQLSAQINSTKVLKLSILILVYSV